MKSSSKSEGSRFLVGTLGKYASSTARLGERRARAIKCLEELEDASISWLPFFAWVRSWVIDELRRSRDGINGCYQISSILTYTTTLLVAQKGIDLSVDPQDWEDGEWSAWVTQVNRVCATGEPSALAVNDGGDLVDRAKHALIALVSSLIRRCEYVPPEVKSKLAFMSGTISPHGSASACLISTRNHVRAVEILKEWNEDFPGDYALAECRSIVSQMVPLRAGDISSLTTCCLTPGGGLVMERVGYDTHKTQNAVRVVPLSEHQASQLRGKINELQRYFGERPLLLRGDGSIESGRRDERLATDWGSALKEATDDPQARSHSARAATLQEIAWPGWQQVAQKILNSRIGPRELRDWVDKQEKDWTRLSKAAVMAGQGDLRSAFGHYLAGWPMVYAIFAGASLEQKAPGLGFLKQLGISPVSLRQARSRSRRRANDKTSSVDAFDVWRWVSNQALKKNLQRGNLPMLSPAPAETGDSASPSAVGEPINGALCDLSSAGNHQDRLTYLTVRSMGLRQELAVERTGLRFRVAVELETISPPESMVATALRRGRQGPQARGQAANINMALSQTGSMLLLWLCRMTPMEYSMVKQLFFRDHLQHPRMPDKVIFWRQIAESLPPELSVHVRIGAKHLSPAEISRLSALAPAVKFVPDPRIGARPVISLFLRNQKNLVVSARLTAVARSYCLAIDALHPFSSSGSCHAG
jgi:hypothetical protein